jgi:hypothetical protein
MKPSWQPENAGFQWVDTLLRIGLDTISLPREVTEENGQNRSLS